MRNIVQRRRPIWSELGMLNSYAKLLWANFHHEILKIRAFPHMKI